MPKRGWPRRGRASTTSRRTGIRCSATFPTFPDSSSSGTEGVDAILAPIFKDVLDHDAGRQFKERLDVFIAEKVAEIEKMCNSNYQEFVSAVEKLLKARKGAAGLRVQSNDFYKFF